MNLSNSHLSKDFYDFVKSIGESRSKQDEDCIVERELYALKSKLNDAHSSQRQLKENVLRAIYCEMLGHDASVSYIHAVNLVHEKPISSKRLGYLACNILLHPDHELTLLIVNALQKDLSSPNRLETSAALSCASQLINVEMVPVILPLVKSLMKHSSSHIRKKACIVLRTIYILSPESLSEATELIKRALCDPDPSVMGASLFLIHDIVKIDAAFGRELIPSLKSILKQICERRLTRDYEYHRVPAPWLQVKLLSILSTVGSLSKANSEAIYDILLFVIRVTDVSISTNFAIIYECVKTIARIYPSHQLLEVAAGCISRFISAANNNLKYVGLVGLAALVQVDSTYATRHQLAVVDCLEDSDDSLKRKTLELLCKITNVMNVTAVVDKLLFHLRTSVDLQFRQELASKLIELSERFSPENNWYLNKMNTVLELAGNLVKRSAAYNLAQLIAEGPTEIEETDEAFRKYAVESYIKLCERHQALPDLLIQVIAWVLGEYGFLLPMPNYTIEDVIHLLCVCADHRFDDEASRGWVITAVMKLCARLDVPLLPYVASLLERYSHSNNTDIQQRCYEAKFVLAGRLSLVDILPYHASTEELDVDSSLAFLNGFVSEFDGANVRRYIPKHVRRPLEASPDPLAAPFSVSTLSYKPYELPPKLPFKTASASESKDSIDERDTIDNKRAFPTTGTTAYGHISQLQVPKIWGPEGFRQRQWTDTTRGIEPCISHGKDVDSLSVASNGTFESKLSDSASHSGDASLDKDSKPSSSSPVTEGSSMPVLTDREKMAAAIFSGIGSHSHVTSDRAVSPNRMPPSRRQKSLASNVDSVDTNSNKLSLLGMDNAEDSTNPLIDVFEEHTDICQSMKSPRSPKAAHEIHESDWLKDRPTVRAAHGTHDFDWLNDSPIAASKPYSATFTLQPQVLTSSEMGLRWISLPFEKRETVPVSVVAHGSASPFIYFLQKALNVFLVEIIGNEAILAGKANRAEDVYIHCKVNVSSLQVTVKSTSMRVAEKVSTTCCQSARSYVQ